MCQALGQMMVMTKKRYEIETITGRKQAQRHLDWVDHGILRYRWHNFSEFATGAYRSNHPSRARFETYAQMGIKDVISLRGGREQPQFLFEVETCAQLGMQLHVAQMAARRAPRVEPLNLLFETFDAVERPFLLHCKSGADRTGLAAALYLLHYESASIATARKQLSFDYIHIKRTATGILDHFIDTYEAAFNETGIKVLDWINTAYDPDALTLSFEAKQKSLWPWQGWR